MTSAGSRFHSRHLIEKNNDNLLDERTFWSSETRNRIKYNTTSNLNEISTYHAIHQVFDVSIFPILPAVVSTESKKREAHTSLRW